MQVKDLQLKRALRTALLILLMNAVGMGKMYAQNLITNGDFEQGNTGFVTDYQYYGPPPYFTDAGVYHVKRNPHDFHTGFFDFHDHTGNNGRFFIANGYGSGSTLRVWSQTVNVEPYSFYEFTFWGTHLSNGYNMSSNRANFYVKINGAQIGSDFAPQFVSNQGYWSQFPVTQWYSGNQTQATITIYDRCTAGSNWGDDFGLDDISFTASSASYCNNITFADANVKAICVANWDTNGDGELSYDEAAVVTDLGYYFHGNSQITSFDELQYFTGLTSIGYYAFSGCSGLTSLTIPNSVTSIVTEAFRGCNGLMSLTIPNSVTSIGSYAFEFCSGLEQIIVDEDNPSYDSRENCNAIIETSTNTLITGCKNTIIPNSVTSIGYAAFCGCSGLTSLIIPNSVTSIGDEAFVYCSGLTSLDLGNSVTSIGSWAFGYCSGLTSLTIHNSVTLIGYDAFNHCSGLEQIIVDEDNPSYDSRECCNAIIEISTNTLITGCKNTIIPNSVTLIGHAAFHGCSGLTSLAIPNSVTSIGSWAFEGCSGLMSLTIPDSVTSIGIDAFSGCSGLTSLYLGNSVTSIGYNAFGGCSGLSTITVLAETPPTLGSSVFYDIDTSIPVYVPCSSISDYQSSAGWNIFTNYKPATTCASGEITVTVNPTEGGTVTGNGYYEGGTLCTLTTIPNEGFSFLNWMENGTIISNDSEYSFVVSGDRELVANFVEGEWCTVIFELFDSYGDGYTGNNLVVTDENGSQQLTVESGSSAVYTFPFSTGSHLTLTWIVGSYPGDCSFTVSYSNGNVIYHGENLSSSFSYEFDVDCSFAPIENIVFADANVKAICVANWDTNGDGELSYDEAAAVTDLGQVFSDNTEITSFEELQYFTGLTTIADYAFENCRNLSGHLYIPNSVTSIESYAFNNCSGLTSIEIPNSMISIGSHAFQGCIGLTIIEIPNSVIYMGENPFNACSGLEQIVVDSENTKYDSRENCNAIIKTIDNQLITGCKNTIIPNSVTSINCAFWLCSGLTSIEIPNSVTSIENEAFRGCTSLTSIEIPSSVTFIADRSFAYCSSLERVIVDSENTVYDSRENCNAIIKSSTNNLISGCKNTIIPNTITSIGNFAFEDCYSLTSIEIPNSVTYIGFCAFDYCSNMVSMTVFGNIPPALSSRVFTIPNKTFPVYVPYGTVDAYQAASGWNEFTNYQEFVYTTISGYGEGEGNYRFIASPLVENTAPTAVDNMITETAYDLYRFDQSEDDEWQNYKYPENTPNFFLTNGQGYLYANAEDVNLIFKGEFNEDETKEVELVYETNADFAGWNLVGNPFPVSAYANKSYYSMNEDGTGIEPVAVSMETAIPACTGVMVKADNTGESVTFSKTAPEAAVNQGVLQIAVAQANQRGTSTGSGNLTLDKAIVSFNAGDALEKFVFNADNAQLYIPQGGKDYAIAYAEKQGEMPLNFKATKNGEYTLAVNLENVEIEYLHLIDNLTGANIDLLATTSYTFESKTTDYASRFRLVFSVCGDPDGDNDAPFAFVSNGEIVIVGDAGDAGTASLQVVDFLGHICRDAMIASPNHRVPTAGMTPGVYVLRLINGDSVRMQKIVIE